MRRRIFIVVIFVLAGGVVNVAVAWGCKAWSTLVVQSPPPITEEFSHLLTRIPTDETGEMWVAHDEIGWTARTRTLRSGIGVRVERNWARRMTDRGELNRDRRDDIAVSTLRVGLPMLSLRGDIAVNQLHVPAIDWVAFHSFTTMPPKNSTVLPLASPARRMWSDGAWFTERADGKRPYALPFYPIWPGFAVNTALYATVLWLLILGLFVVRNFSRVRRGLCHACAYPRGESAVCSECGKALSSMSKPSVIQ